MPYNRYLQISKERYEVLCNRYDQYMKNVDNLDSEPVKIFDPLSTKHLEELELIREVSRELAQKKNDDLKKAKQAAEADAKAAEAIASTETEVNDTETTPAEG